MRHSAVRCALQCGVPGRPTTTRLAGTARSSMLTRRGACMRGLPVQAPELLALLRALADMADYAPPLQPLTELSASAPASGSAGGAGNGSGVASALDSAQALSTRVVAPLLQHLQQGFSSCSARWGAGASAKPLQGSHACTRACGTVTAIPHAMASWRVANCLCGGTGSANTAFWAHTLCSKPS